MMADLTAAGDHVGFLPSSSAPEPAMCGDAMDVPDRKPNVSPLKPTGETAASTATPGAVTSGLSRSPLDARVGPREENSAICGTGGGSAPVVSVAFRLAVMPGVAFTTSLIFGSPTWTVGTLCRSASSEPGVRLTRTMPTPPARLTSALLSTRATTPRSQTTILPATLAGSSELGAHSAASVARAAAVFTSTASTIGLESTSLLMTLAPANLLPSDSSAVPRRVLSNVEAATLVIQGPAWLTVEAVGPELPAEAATKIPAAAALRNARETASTVELLFPEMEKFSTSTP